jgi:glycerol-3-phosphate dehydrogenase
MQASSDFLKGLAPLIPEDTLIVSTSKGLHTQTLQMMSEVIPAALDRPDQPTAFLSGPSLAKVLFNFSCRTAAKLNFSAWPLQEIIEGMPTGFTVASARTFADS